MTTPRPAAALSRAQRARRKQDLLLASQALRLEAGVALAQLAERADTLESAVLRVRAVLAGPIGVVGAGVGLGVVVWLGLRGRARPRRWRLLHWGWLAWRWWLLIPPAWRARLLHG
jgi:hypothetical protein